MLPPSAASAGMPPSMPSPESTCSPELWASRATIASGRESWSIRLKVPAPKPSIGRSVKACQASLHQR